MLNELTLFEQLERDGYTEEAETLKECYRNAVILKYRLAEGEVPIGASKGGCPDLPPEIELPDMPLLVQINLYELAESGADVENLLPKTGMLYIFWNEEIDEEEIDECDYDIIHWDGDMSTLRRCGNPDERECTIGFEAHDEYDGREIDEELYRLIQDYGYDPDGLAEMADKLLGYPAGGNKPDFSEEDVLLFQYNYNIGCVWSEYWIMRKEDLKKGEVYGWFYYDMD